MKNKVINLIFSFIVLVFLIVNMYMTGYLVDEYGSIFELFPNYILITRLSSILIVFSLITFVINLIPLLKKKTKKSE